MAFKAAEHPSTSLPPRTRARAAYKCPAGQPNALLNVWPLPLRHEWHEALNGRAGAAARVPAAPGPSFSRGARRKSSARRRPRAARTGSEEPAPAVRGILSHPLGCGASRWRRSRRSGSYQGGIGVARAAAPAVLQFCFTDAAPAPCAIYDGRFGTASRAEASDRVAEEAAGPLRVAHPRRGPSSFARRGGDALHSRGSDASRRRRRRRSISGLPIYGRRSVEAGPPHD